MNAGAFHYLAAQASGGLQGDRLQSTEFPAGLKTLRASAHHTPVLATYHYP